MPYICDHCEEQELDREYDSFARERNAMREERQG